MCVYQQVYTYVWGAVCLEITRYLYTYISPVIFINLHWYLHVYIPTEINSYGDIINVD